MSDWIGDLKDYCHLERYGYFAHVECMDKGEWWFCVTKGKFPNCTELYNTAENKTAVRLKSGKAARVAAECVIEALERIRRNGPSLSVK